MYARWIGAGPCSVNTERWVVLNTALALPQHNGDSNVVYKQSSPASLNDFLLNKACRMDQNKRRRYYTIIFKLQVVDYAKEHGNRATERRFGPPPTVKMVRACFHQKVFFLKLSLQNMGASYGKGRLIRREIRYFTQ